MENHNFVTQYSIAIRKTQNFPVTLKILLVALVVLCSQAVSAFTNDTLKIFSYNTLNYGVGATKQCPGLLTFKKHVYLREILKYERPDIIAFMKMDSSTSFATDTIPNKILDSVCYKCYNHGIPTNHHGYAKIDMMYYRNDKLGFVSTSTLVSGNNVDSISDINVHKLYYKSPDLPTTHDTQFINIIVVHLYSGKLNSLYRSNEILGMMDTIQARYTSLGNFIVTGDFNSQSCTELCYEYLTSPSDTNYRFYDPGFFNKDWKGNDALYAKYLTQTTRVDTLTDCGSTGGLKDIYDHMLFTRSLMDGLDSVKYLPGSYHVVGQDGKHTGHALIDTPANIIVPTNIVKDLYYMSNHLPIESKIVISAPATVTGIAKNDITDPNISARFNSEKLLIDLKDNDALLTERSSVKLYDMNGKVIYSNIMNLKTSNSIDVPTISNGTYVLSINDHSGRVYSKKLIRL